MTRPFELSMDWPMELSGGVISNTGKVWNILSASRKGDLESVKKMVDACPELIYAQYNYTPPIHFAVREGHHNLVRYLLEQGAHDPEYKIYPFLDPLQTIARDRGHDLIALSLDEYAGNPSLQKFNGDNGKIYFPRTSLQKEFEQTIYEQDLEAAESLLKTNPELIHDETYFWGEGILMMPAKVNNPAMVTMLIEHGAKIPSILKWTQFYYFKHFDMAVFLMEMGMNPNIMSWHQVTILHDMAQKGELAKAELLIKHGAEINSLEDEYESTPLAMAARWGFLEMVEYLLGQGADPNLSGASWSTPLAWARKKGHHAIEEKLIRGGAR